MTEAKAGGRTPIYEALVRERGGRPPGTPAPRQAPPALTLEKLQGAHRPPTPPWVTGGGRKPRSGARRPSGTPQKAEPASA